MKEYTKESKRDVMIFLTTQLDKLEKDIYYTRKQKDIHLEEVWEERENELTLLRDFIERLIDEVME